MKAAFNPMNKQHLLFYQSDVLDMVFLISIGLVIAAIVIGIILVVMMRRSKANKPNDSEALAEPPPAADDQLDQLSETAPSLPAVDDEADKDDTEPSLPVIKSVGEPNVLPISGQRPPDIGWNIASLTDVGLRRELNEDNMLMLEAENSNFGPYGIYVVADGLGGHVAGEVASQLTVEAIEQQHEQNPPPLGADSIEEWLKDATTGANEFVLKYQQENDDSKKMGSTLVMSLVTDNNAHILNVGDSRAYHLDHDQIQQISVDHSLVERLVQIGQITREEARTHKQRNVIYSTLGEKRKMEMGYYHVTLKPGDRLLLCSDGLTEKLPDDEILKISQHQTDPAVAVQVLIEAAKQAGGDDNITAIMIQMNK